MSAPESADIETDRLDGEVHPADCALLDHLERADEDYFPGYDTIEALANPGNREALMVWLAARGIIS